MYFVSLIILCLPVLMETNNFNIEDSIILDSILKPLEAKSIRIYIAENPEIISNLQNLGVVQIDQDDIELKLEEEQLQRFLRKDNIELGKMGAGIILPKNLSPKLQTKVDSMYKRHYFNEYVSNMIPVQRKLMDVRPE